MEKIGITFGELQTAAISVVASIVLSLILYVISANLVGSMAAGLALEIVLVSHRILSQVGQFGRRLGNISALPELVNIMSDLDTLSRRSGRFQVLMLKTTIRQFEMHVSHLRHGRQTMTLDQFMVMARAIYNDLGPQDALLATSYLAGGDYWTTNYGVEYSNLNREAFLRGATIDRIYMLHGSEHEEKVDRILTLQSENSNVYVLNIDASPLPYAEHRDFFVVNNEIAAEFNFAGGQVVSSVTIITDFHLVAELIDLGKKLKGYSSKFKKVSSHDRTKRIEV